jgi:hypothetical protein
MYRLKLFLGCIFGICALSGCFLPDNNQRQNPSSDMPILGDAISTALPLSSEDIFIGDEPKLPNSIEGLIEVLEEGSILARIMASRKVSSMGEEAIKAVPALSANLTHEDFEVREATADALGRIGKPAKYALPFLIEALDDNNLKVGDRVAWAIGELGDISAVPVLAETLYRGSQGDHYRVARRAAHSIEKLTGITFVEPSYKSDWMNELGIPFIVVEARTWWEIEGYTQDWHIK